MAHINDNFLKLPGSYLFSEIARRTAAYTAAHPEVSLIRLGIGDVTRPLPAAVTAAFSYITPAIFGAIIRDYAMKNVKSHLPLIIAGVVFFLLFKALGLSSVWITLFVVITGMFVSRIMFTYYKKKNSAKAP